MAVAPPATKPMMKKDGNRRDVAAAGCARCGPPNWSGSIGSGSRPSQPRAGMWHMRERSEKAAVVTVRSAQDVGTQRAGRGSRRGIVSRASRLVGEGGSIVGSRVGGETNGYASTSIA